MPKGRLCKICQLFRYLQISEFTATSGFPARNPDPVFFPHSCPDPVPDVKSRNKHNPTIYNGKQFLFFNFWFCQFEEISKSAKKNIKKTYIIWLFYRGIYFGRESYSPSLYFGDISPPPFLILPNILARAKPAKFFGILSEKCHFEAKWRGKK